MGVKTEKKSTTHFKRKHLAVAVAGSKAVKKFRDTEKKKDAKRTKLEKQKQAADDAELQKKKETAAFVKYVKAIKEKLGDDIIEGGEDSDEDFDFGESDEDADMLVFDEDSNMQKFAVASDDEEEEEVEEEEDEDLEALDEDDYDNEEALMDEDEDDIDDEYDASAVDGGVFETIDDEYNVDEDEDEEELGDEALLAKHKHELEQIRVTDPELYAHLQTHGKDLLRFGEDGLDTEAAEPKSKKPLIEKLTKESYLSLRKPFDNNSFTAAHVLQLVKIFKSAVMVRRAGQDEAAKHKANGRAARIEAKYMELTSSKLYNHFLQFALRTIPTALVLLLCRSSAITEGVPKGTFKDISVGLSDGPVAWAGTPLKSLAGNAKVQPMAQAYFQAVSFLLQESVDAMFTRFILRTMLPAVPLLEELPKPTPKLLKSLLRVWSMGASASATHDENGASRFAIDHSSRVDAFLVIRRMCLTMPPRSKVLEATMKNIYLSFVRVSKQVNQHTAATISFLCNCVTEIYGLDKTAAYQYAFVYIRQLAIHLRSAIHKPSEDSVRSIYNWQYVNCFRVWAQILSTHAADNTSSLFPLVYPFFQVALGVMELSASPQYYPVRFNMAQFINQVASASKIYVPMAPQLLSIFTSNLMRQKAGKTKDSKSIRKRANDVKYKLHVSSGVITSEAYKEMVLKRTIDQLTHHLACFSQSIAFPELILPIKFMLKRFVKDTAVPSAGKAARQLLTVMNENSKYILQRRQQVTFSPKDLLAKGLSGMDTFANPTLIASLNQQVNNSKFAGLAPGSNKTGSVRKSPLEGLWEVRVKALEMEERENVVLAAQELNEELDGDDEMVDQGEDDDEQEFDDEDDMDEDEEEEEVVVPKKKKRTRAHVEDVDLEEIDDMQDEVEDFVFSDSEDEAAKPKAKAAKKSAPKGKVAKKQRK